MLDLLRVNGTICGKDGNHRTACSQRTTEEHSAEYHVRQARNTANHAAGDVESKEVTSTDLLMQRDPEEV